MNFVHDILLENIAGKLSALVLAHFGNYLCNSALCRGGGAVADLRRLFLLYKADSALRKVADHALHVATDVADLGILCCLHL